LSFFSSLLHFTLVTLFGSFRPYKKEILFQPLFPGKIRVSLLFPSRRFSPPLYCLLADKDRGDYLLPPSPTLLRYRRDMFTIPFLYRNTTPPPPLSFDPGLARHSFPCPRMNMSRFRTSPFSVSRRLVNSPSRFRWRDAIFLFSRQAFSPFSPTVATHQFLLS